MSQKPMISVVVPVFNEEESLPFLVEAVSDALRTQWRWELLIVDDGSRDRTADIAAAFALDYSRIRV